MRNQVIHQPFALAGSDGYPLRGDVRHLEGRARSPAIVICHGFKGFKDWGFFPTLAARLAEAGFLAVSFNFSGSGIGERPDQFDEVERFERATLSADLDDLDRILDQLLAGNLPGPTPERPLGILGHSRGGGICLLQAARDARVGCLTTWSSIATFARYDQQQLAQWRRDGFFEIQNARTGQTFRLHRSQLDDIEQNRQRYDLLAAAGRLATPWLIVHGGADETVPVAEARQLAEAAGSAAARLVTVAGAGHTFGAVHPFAGEPPGLETALAATVEFFHRHLPV